MAPNALDKLKDDHHALEDLFQKFEQGRDDSLQQIVEESLAQLEVHTNLEEDLIYPAVRHVILAKETIDDAIEVHHVLSLLARELRKMPATDARYRAKFRVLSQIVRHHISEEETRIFPKAEQAGLDWIALGQEATVLHDNLMNRKRAKKKSPQQHSCPTTR
jgi:hemerythrin superfamily protein